MRCARLGQLDARAPALRGLLGALASLAAACGPGANHPTPPSPSASPGQTAGLEFGGPETMYTMAEARCPGVTAEWRGVSVRPSELRDRGLRSVRLRFEGGEEVVLWRTETAYDWPEVVFSPDCQRVALLESRHGPYVIVATRDLRARARGEATPARYLDDQRPCALAFVYGGLKWVSNETVEYRSGGEPMQARRVNVDGAPDRLTQHPCLDPGHPLYEGPDAGAPRSSP